MLQAIKLLLIKNMLWQDVYYSSLVHSYHKSPNSIYMKKHVLQYWQGHLNKPARAAGLLWFEGSALERQDGPIVEEAGTQRELI